MIYNNSLRPSTLFAIVLLLLAAAGAMMWLSLLVDEEIEAFDLPALILLGFDLGIWVICALFWPRVRGVRIVTSLLLHGLLAGLGVLVFVVLCEDKTVEGRLLLAALVGLGAGLCVMGILALHHRAMKSDLSGEGESPEAGAQRWSHKHRVLVAALAVVLLSLAYGVWRVIPLLTAEPTVTVDYLAEANRLSKPAGYDPNLNAASHCERLFAEFVPLPEGLEDQWKAWPTDLSAEQQERLKAWLPRNEAVLESLGKAAQCPYWWRELASSDGALSGIVVPELEAVRRCAWGVVLRAKQQAWEGGSGDALTVLADLYHLGVHWTQGATLVEQLVGVALCNVSADGMLAVLDHCEVSAGPLRDALDAVRSGVCKVSVPRFGEAEEVYGYDSIQRCFTDAGDGNGKLIPKRFYEAKKARPSLYSHPISYLDALWISLNHPDRFETTALFATYISSVETLARQTPWQLHAAMTSYEEELEELLGGNYYLRDGFMATAQCIRTGWRGKAAGRALVVVLAVLMYKAHGGALPESLDALVGEGLLLETIPTDPYSDGSLIYRVTGDEFTVYSVGEDFFDDGGVSGAWDNPGCDRVFWPVEADL